MKILKALMLVVLILATSTACAADNRAALKDFGEISKTVNNFSWNYYRQLDKSKNIFYSPYSIAAAFSIVANGATGQTQKEILNVLNTKEIKNLNGDFENFRALMEKNYSDETVLKEADLILVNKNHIGKGINSKFEKVVKEIYQSEIDAADFSGNTDAEKARIQNWVAKNTNDFIPNYEASISADTIVDILNVIYFKGSWQSPFETSKTWKSDFTNNNGKKSKVQMMSKTFEDSIAYYADEKYMAVALPYKNNLAAMYIILPRRENDLNVAEDWDAEEISYRENFLSNLKHAPIFDGIVEFFMPKFELDIKNKLNDDLQAMGINRAFTDDAEFYNIVKKMQLKISNATHQAKVKVDEEGTEAAAVTEIDMVKATAVPIQPRTIYFRADRPFLFVIRDVASEVDLFTGVVNSL